MAKYTAKVDRVARKVMKRTKSMLKSAASIQADKEERKNIPWREKEEHVENH